MVRKETRRRKKRRREGRETGIPVYFCCLGSMQTKEEGAAAVLQMKEEDNI